MLYRHLTTCVLVLSFICGGQLSATFAAPQDQKGEKKQDDKKKDEKKQDDEDKRDKASALVGEGMQLTREQKWADAAAKFTEAVELDAENGQAWFYKGYTLHMNGDLDEALKAHTKACEFDRFKPIALYNVACVHALKKDKEQALEYLGKSADAGFRSPTPLTDDADLEILYEDEKFKEIAKRMEGRDGGNF